MTLPRLCLLVLLGASAAHAQSDESHLTKTISRGLEAATAAMPAVRYLDDGAQQRETGRRMMDALLIDTAATYGLKWAIKSPRPRGGDDGFPSYHTSAAFATAVALLEREPKATWFALPLAATAGWARVDLEEHTWAQMIAGAALGAFVGHMCGSGQWRMIPRGDPFPAETASSGEPVAPLRGLSAPPRGVGPWGSVRSTVLWHTEF